MDTRDINQAIRTNMFYCTEYIDHDIRNAIIKWQVRNTNTNDYSN